MYLNIIYMLKAPKFNTSPHFNWCPTFLLVQLLTLKTLKLSFIPLFLFISYFQSLRKFCWLYPENISTIRRLLSTTSTASILVWATTIQWIVEIAPSWSPCSYPCPLECIFSIETRLVLWNLNQIISWNPANVPHFTKRERSYVAE